MLTGLRMDVHFFALSFWLWILNPGRAMMKLMAVTYFGTLYSDGFASELSLFVEFLAKHQMTISLKRNPSKSIDFTKVIFARPCSCDGSRKKTSAFFSCYSYAAVVRRFYLSINHFRDSNPPKFMQSRILQAL